MDGVRRLVGLHLVARLLGKDEIEYDESGGNGSDGVGHV